MGCSMKGAENPRWKGGLTFDSDSGRWQINCRDGSRIYYYRAVMEAHLGRALERHEHVHHINGDPGDDRIENLELIDIRDHGALHGRAAWVQRKAAWKYDWAQDHPCCVKCGTTERKHQAHGLCLRCDSTVRMRAYRAAKKAAA